MSRTCCALLVLGAQATGVANECGPNEYLVKKSATKIAVCKPVSPQCHGSSYEYRAPTDVADRVCRVCGVFSNRVVSQDRKKCLELPNATSDPVRKREILGQVSRPPTPWRDECLEGQAWRFDRARNKHICVHCPAGRFAGQTACAPCPVGKFSITTSKSSCHRCPSGRFGSSTLEISPGCTGPCPLGHYCLAGASHGVPCPAGTYGKHHGSKTSLCSGACPAGRFSEIESQDCSSCDPGKFQASPISRSCAVCPGGKYAGSNYAGNQRCQVCRRGKFSSAGNSSCMVCPNSQVSADESTACHTCSVGKKYSPYFCEVDADVGNFCAPACVDCPAGKYQPHLGAFSCIKCPPGKFSADHSAPTCVQCAQGTYSQTNASKSCLQCPLGKHATSPGAPSCSWIPTPVPTPVPPTPAPTTTPTRSPTPAPTSPPTLQPTPAPTPLCPDGHYFQSGLLCVACPAGKYRLKDDAHSCNACPKGKYIAAEAGTDCKLCAEGYYGAAEGLNASTCTALRPHPDHLRSINLMILCRFGKVPSRA
jgi:hypothetical protein